MKSNMKKLFSHKKLKCLSAALACGMVFAMSGSSTAFAGVLPDNPDLPSSLYGAEEDNDISGVKADKKGVTTDIGSATNSGVYFTVQGGNWENIYGGYSESNGVDTTRNVVKISGGTISGNIYGGYSENGHAKNNQVEINSSIGSSDTPNLNIYGGYSAGKSADGNNVIIGTLANRVTVNGNVFGGYANQSATNNTVTIKNGTINGSVFAGVGKVASFDNVVNLGFYDGSQETATINGDLYLNVRERSNSSDKYEWYSQGTLNVYSFGNEIHGNLHCEHDILNFYWNPNNYYGYDSVEKLIEAKVPMLYVKCKRNEDGTIVKNSVAYMDKATVRVGMDNIGKIDDSVIGKTITLLKVEEDGVLHANSIKTGVISDGIIEADLKIRKDGNSLTATPVAQSFTATTDSKSPSETQAASLSLINISGDMFSGSILSSAAKAISIEKANLVAVGSGDGKKDAETGEPSKPTVVQQSAVRNMTPFATMGAGSSTIQSGSHVDMTTWNIAVGFAKEVANKNGTFMFGPVLEYGRGNYDSYVESLTGDTHGSGTSSFYGIGFMAKQTYNNDVYVDGSVRFGHAKNDYNAFYGYSDKGYENSTNYYGAHIGVGKVVKLNKKDSLDYYGKLFYSHQNGSRATLNSGHIYDFDAVDSFRTRLGFRINHILNDISTFYAGLAWQHEFASECNATIHSGMWTMEAPAPSVEGDTGILELGWNIKADQGRFETGLGLTGSIGKQRGIGGNIEFKWNF